MMGFKAFHSAQATIAGIETAHMIRKGQLSEENMPAYKQFIRSQHRVYDGRGEVARTQDVWAPKALAVALSFCRLLGLGCPKQAFAKIATPRLLFV
jgi:hypothetical protein